MIKKTIKIGMLQIGIQCVDGVGTIRCPTHRETKAVYQIIKTKALENLGVGLNDNNDIKYSERLNCIIEKFPNKTEKEIMELIESDINKREEIVGKVKKQVEENKK